VNTHGGTLFLLPTLLGDTAPDHVLPAATLAVARRTRFFLAENAKSARAFLNAIGHPEPVSSLSIAEIGHTPDARHFDAWLAPAREGHDIALVSEAGCPAVADPGAELVAHAHRNRLKVRPLVGPSSLMLALMASGMNGQRFRFVGYLPQDRRALAQAIDALERSSGGEETQLFIETPYRNERLLRALIEHACADTRLALAIDLTTPGEQVLSLRISEWRTLPSAAMPPIERRPTVFALLSAAQRLPAAPRGRTAASGRQ
jgi:16S rRNA (cytidine1402-2'-O)-methyltransferase